MRGIVDLCVREGLILCADEVYQENVWEEGKEFVSFRKVAIEMGYTGEEEITKPGEGLQLVSFHSVSKGFLGECGLRGGYFQVHGIPAAAAAQVYKLASISLCRWAAGPQHGGPADHGPDVRAAPAGVAFLQKVRPRARRHPRLHAPARRPARRRPQPARGRQLQQRPGGHVRVPPDHAPPAGCGRGGCRGRGSRRLLLHAAAGGHGHHRGPRLRVRPAGGHLALPHNLPSLGGPDGWRGGPAG
ncbi:unnamed protein product, partial [Heterosigma akashiwo]